VPTAVELDASPTGGSSSVSGSTSESPIEFRLDLASGVPT